MNMGKNKKGQKLKNTANKMWKEAEQKPKYRRAVTMEAYRTTTRRIVTEVLDGIFLCLNEKNQEKSLKVQNRILRRIVEKRQAQTAYRISGNVYDIKAQRLAKRMTSECISHIRKKRFAA